MKVISKALRESDGIVERFQKGLAVSAAALALFTGSVDPSVRLFVSIHVL
jgi:hypothetical protein